MAANAVIGALRVTLGLDSAHFRKGLKDSHSDLAGFAKSAGAAAAAVGVALAAAAVAVGAAVKSSIDRADELGKAAQKTGTTVESLSRLAYAGDLADVSLDQLSTGLKKVSANAAEVATGGGAKAAKAFDALGISVTDTNGSLKSGDVLIREVAARFGTMEDGASKTAMAMALFGKSGADMIPLLNAGAEGLAAAEAEAVALGVALDTQTAKAAEEFNDNLTRLKTAGSGLSTQLAAGLAPALASISGALVNTAKNADVMRGVGTALSAVLKVLATGAVALTAAFSSVGAGIGSVAQVIMKAFTGDFAGAWEAYKTGFTKNLSILSNAAGSVRRIWSAAASEIPASARAVGAGVEAPMMRAEGATRKAGKAATEAVEGWAKAVQDAETAGLRFAGALRTETAEMGLSNRELKARNIHLEEMIALAHGLPVVAAEIRAAGEAMLAATDATALKDGLDDMVEALDDYLERLRGLPDDARNGAARLAEMFEAGRAGAFDLQRSVDDLFYGIADNDWLGAFSGLFRTISLLQAEFAKTGNLAGKIGAVGGTVSAVGNVVGGKAGSALAGIGGGIAAGAQLGSIVPGIGTAVGAAIGGIVGGLKSLFGGSSAKKKAKKEAEARAREEAARKAAELAAAQRSLEIEVMRLSGRTAEALAEARKDELAAMDPSLHALQEQAWALEDKAEAEARAADLLADRTRLERELLRLQDEGAALAADRADAMAAADENLRPLLASIYSVMDAQAAAAAAEADWAEKTARVAEAEAAARDRLREAFDRDAEAFEATAERFGEIADELAALGRSLRAGGLSGADPAAQARAARAAFAEAEAAVARGDAGALDGLSGVIGDFASNARATATDAVSLARDLSRARSLAARGEALARAQVDTATRQLTELKTLVAGQLEVETAIGAVADELKNVVRAIHETALTEDRALQAMSAFQAASAPAVVPPAQTIPTFSPADVAAVVDALVSTEALDATVAGHLISPVDADKINAALAAIAVNTGQQNRLFKRWDGDGMPDVRVVA
jgi:hypothetical protein